MSYFYVFCTVLLTVYGQLVIKWQVTDVGLIPSGLFDKLVYFSRFLFNPWILSAYIAALLASVTWMAAISKLDLSHAYPFMGLAFVLVLIFGAIFFNEAFNLYKISGVLLIILGLAISSQG